MSMGVRHCRISFRSRCILESARGDTVAPRRWPSTGGLVGRDLLTRWVAQVSADTLRCYERARLLRPRSKSVSGYRLYDEEAARRIQFIRHAQDWWVYVGRDSRSLDIARPCLGLLR